MLVLSRFVGERIVCRVGGEILVISIGAVHGDRVRLCLDAPESVSIDREEVARKKGEWKEQPTKRPTKSPS